MSGRDLLLAYFASPGSLTQGDVAARAGITAGYVSMLLSGERTVSGLEAAHGIERATGGAVPAESWLHDLSKRTADLDRKPPRRVVRRRSGRSPRNSTDRR